MDSNEWEEFLREQQNARAIEEQKILAENAAAIDKIRFIGELAGVPANEIIFSYHVTTGIVASYPNFTAHLLPELTQDKDGLYGFDQLLGSFSRKMEQPGLLFSQDYAVMANNYFRRSYSELNSFAPRFLEYFWKLSDNRIKQLISLDADRIRVDVNTPPYGEKDTWFGAQYNENIASIGDGVVKLVPPGYLDPHHIRHFFDSVATLNVKWSTSKNLRNFYAEEIKTDDVSILLNDDIYCPARYIHAQYDLDRGQFIHLDGTMHFYTPAERESLHWGDLNYNEKHDRHVKGLSKKLFRFDGVIEPAIWTEFICQFFHGDPLILEYFTGGYPDHILKMLQKVRQLKNIDN